MQLAREGFDHFFVLMSKLGYLYGVVPFDIALVLVLALLRRFREATFAALALGGSALLNIAVEAGVRARAAVAVGVDRAGDDFQFPQRPCHGFGDAGLRAGRCWPGARRWRWPVVALAGAFVVRSGCRASTWACITRPTSSAGWAAAQRCGRLAGYLVVFRAAACGRWQRVPQPRPESLAGLGRGVGAAVAARRASCASRWAM